MNLYKYFKLSGIKLLFSIFYILISGSVFCQLNQIKSIEIENNVKGVDIEYKVTPLKTGGFLLQERNEGLIGKRNIIWTTKKYSNDLELLWKTEIEIPTMLDFEMETLNNDALYQNFSYSNSTKIKLLKIDLNKGETDWVEADLIGIQDYRQMKVVGNTAFYSGKFQGRAVVMGLSFFDNTVKAINGLYANHMEVVEIDTDENQKNLHIFTKNRYKGNCELELRVFNESGQQLMNTKLENDFRKIPFNGRIYDLNPQESLLIGNYGRYCDNFSQGIYVKKNSEMGNTKTKFLDFSEFNNFFNYLNPKRQQKVKDRLNKRKEAGKAIKFNYSMLVHKLIKFNNQLVMVAEIYYTETKTNAGLPYSVNGKGYNQFNYKFTHTIICGFDKDGNKLWDNCLPMKALVSNYLNEQVQLSQFGNKLILAYPEEGKIKTQVIEGEKNIGEKAVFEMTDKKESFWDDDSDSGFSAWYDQNFLYWGYKNQPNGSSLINDKVFFINKLTYIL